MLQHQRGSVVITCYMVTTALLAYGSSLLVRSLSETAISQRFARSSLAAHLAEAGLDYGMAQLKANSGWTGTSYTALAGGTGGYAVTVTNLGSGLKQITSTGYSPSNVTTDAWYQTRQVEAVVEVESPSVFQFALFGQERVRIKVDDEDDEEDKDDAEAPEDIVLLDSYDSSLGTYASQTPGQDADIGTNDTHDKSIRLRELAGGGEVIVKGQIQADEEDAVDIEGDVTITGDPDVVDQTALPDTLPAVDAPDICDDAQDLLIRNAETLTLTEANSPYCYKKLTMRNSASVVVQGNVVVYANTFKAVDDAQINAAGKPTQLVLQLTDHTKVMLKHNVRFSGGIYAPASQVKLKDDVVFYGAVVGKRIKAKHNAKVHYDKALTTVGPSIDGTSTIGLYSWREP